LVYREIKKLLNIFSLHGKYFQDDENRFTANFLFLLSEARTVLLPALVKDLNLDPSGLNFAAADIVFQSHLPSGTDIPDAEIRLGDHIQILLEAKIDRNGLGLDQIRRYATYLAGTAMRQKRLLCVTQFNDQENFNSITRDLDGLHLPASAYTYRQWHHLLDLVKKGLGISASNHQASDNRVLYGRSVNYHQRIAALFIQEVEQTMFDKKSVNELRAGDLEDVKVTCQKPWFMRIAREYNVWFPSGATAYGLCPSRYVAYYETADAENENPSQIAYIARNRIFWNRISIGDARQIEELVPLFSDHRAADEIATWGEPQKTFHVALTEPPVRLSRPIPLQNPKYARVLSRRNYSFTKFLNARTVDDFF
jgi:hypothetical protein